MPERSDATTLIAVATIAAVFDQLTKFAFRSLIVSREGTSRFDLIDGLVALEYTENRGAAFGLLAGLAPVLALTSVAVLVALLLYYARQPLPAVWQTLAVGLIAGGALGNLVDRVRLGYVVDFVSVGPWPNFNGADAAITIGVSIWLWGWFRSDPDWGATRVIDQES